VNQAEQQIQQQYSDQLGAYVQEKAEQIDSLQSGPAASLTSEQGQLHRARRAGRPAKKPTLNGNNRLRDERPGSRSAWIGWGRVKKRPGSTQNENRRTSRT
jgi:hypothetical protein